MADFDATLGLNPSQYNRGMDAARAKAGGLDRVINKVGNSFANKFLSLFSAGAAISIVRAMADTAVETKRLSDSLGFSTDQIQAIAAYSKETGKSFDEIASSVIEVNKALESASQKKLAVFSKEAIDAIAQAKGDIDAIVQQIKSGGAEIFGEALSQAASESLLTKAVGVLRLLGPLQFLNLIPGIKHQRSSPNFEPINQLPVTDDRLESSRKNLFLANRKFEDTVNPAGRRQRLTEELGTIADLIKQLSGQPDQEALLNEVRTRRAVVGAELVGGFKSQLPKPDSLVSVGNFIGTNPDRATEQINIQREMLAKLKELVQDQRNKPGVSLRSN